MRKGIDLGDFFIIGALHTDQQPAAMPFASFPIIDRRIKHAPSGHWKEDEPPDMPALKKLLEERFEAVDFQFDFPPTNHPKPAGRR